MTRADSRVVAFLRPDTAIDPQPAAELPFGEPAKVVELPKRKRPAPAVVPGTSAAFERAWVAYAALDGMRRSTRRLSWPQWLTVARVLGEEALENAVYAFVRDPEAKSQAARTGAAGFQVWLRQGRYEHWLGQGQTTAPTAPTVSVPEPIFRAVCDKWGRDYATSWLSGARMSESRPGSLVVTTGIACDRLYSECRRELAAAGVKLIVAVRDGQVRGRHDL